MALRNIVEIGDDILRKTCRPVPEITPRIRTLVGDMIDTLHDVGGVGLAAPQVGVMRRLFVIDLGDAEEPYPEDEEASEASSGPAYEYPIVLINPEILETSGEQDGDEGCLSIPDKAGSVIRPEYVKIRALNIDGEEVEYEGTGLLARAFCHEYDHLDGIMYIDKAYDIWEIRETEE